VLRHAAGLGCNVVAGYREEMNVDEDGLAVLQVSGTGILVGETDVRSRTNIELPVVKSCRSLHLPYRRNSAPFPMAFTQCGMCNKKKYVPEILLASIELPPELDRVGNVSLIEAHVCRLKKSKVGESVSLRTLFLFRMPCLSVMRFLLSSMISISNWCTRCV
jgi:hypothetical protein